MADEKCPYWFGRIIRTDTNVPTLQARTHGPGDDGEFPQHRGGGTVVHHAAADLRVRSRYAGCADAQRGNARCRADLFRLLTRGVGADLPSGGASSGRNAPSAVNTQAEHPAG